MDDWQRFRFADRLGILCGVHRVKAIIDATDSAIRPWFGETVVIVDQAQPGDEEEKAEKKVSKKKKASEPEADNIAIGETTA